MVTAQTFSVVTRGQSKLGTGDDGDGTSEARTRGYLLIIICICFHVRSELLADVRLKVLV